ncbi:hypothetical protein BU019_10720 [Staphylococcus simulans]|nr:hypothetical protein BU019_10720 [Staphylococcus simulans]
MRIKLKKKYLYEKFEVRARFNLNGKVMKKFSRVTATVDILRMVIDGIKSAKNNNFSKHFMKYNVLNNSN